MNVPNHGGRPGSFATALASDGHDVPSAYYSIIDDMFNSRSSSVDYSCNTHNEVTPMQNGLILSPGEIPALIVCPHCGALVSTVIQYRAGLLTYLLMAGLCLICLWPCVCCPLCFDGIKDTAHICPNCYREVQRRRRLDF